MAPTGPIAVYGATGYTGRLVVAELQRRGLDIVVSGRDADRLRELASGLERPVECHAATVDDRPALRHAIGDCAVVINCAGPFVRFGEPVVRAAVETGTHYVDTTGEQSFMQLIFERYHDAAVAAEIAVVPGMGFDYLPGDLICSLAAEGHEPLRELVVAYDVAGFGATRGTLRSALEIMKGGDLAYADGEWRSAGSGPLRTHFSFPEPIGRRSMGKYPSGEIVTAPRHIRTRRVSSLISSRPFVPSESLAPLVPLAMPGLSLALRTPLRPVLSTAISALREGPSEDDRRGARWTVVALAFGESGSIGRGVVSGSDVYGITAVTTTHGADLMTGDGFDRAGVLAPAQAYDPIPFLNFLGDHGVAYEVGTAARAGAPA